MPTRVTVIEESLERTLLPHRKHARASASDGLWPPRFRRKQSQETVDVFGHVNNHDALLRIRNGHRLSTVGEVVAVRQGNLQRRHRVRVKLQLDEVVLAVQPDEPDVVELVAKNRDGGEEVLGLIGRPGLSLDCTYAHCGPSDLPG